MDYKKAFETMVSETAKYLADNGLKTMILGLSGGLDSTVTAAICHEVVNRYPEHGFKFIGVSCRARLTPSRKTTRQAWP